MRIQNSKFKIQNLGIIILLLTAFCLLPPMISAGEKWSGVDESVIEKYANDHGREAKEPLINTDQGDLLLFVFLLAGVVGGFVGGYYWRTLTEKRKPFVPLSPGRLCRKSVHGSTGSPRTDKAN
jgi:ABC-type cobalt transport system substrate-binding protein